MAASDYFFPALIGGGVGAAGAAIVHDFSFAADTIRKLDFEAASVLSSPRPTKNARAVAAWRNEAIKISDYCKALNLKLQFSQGAFILAGFALGTFLFKAWYDATEPQTETKTKSAKSK